MPGVDGVHDLQHPAMAFAQGGAVDIERLAFGLCLWCPRIRRGVDHVVLEVGGDDMGSGRLGRGQWVDTDHHDVASVIQQTQARGGPAQRGKVFTRVVEAIMDGQGRAQIGQAAGEGGQARRQAFKLLCERQVLTIAVGVASPGADERDVEGLQIAQAADECLAQGVHFSDRQGPPVGLEPEMGAHAKLARQSGHLIQPPWTLQVPVTQSGETEPVGCAPAQLIEGTIAVPPA